MNVSPEHLNIFLSWLLSSSAQACVLICLILAVQALLRNKLAPRWKYSLWLLLVIRLAWKERLPMV